MSAHVKEHMHPDGGTIDGRLCDVQIMENKAMKKLVKVRNEEILLIEHRRAHNICIELAGVRMPFPDIKVYSFSNLDSEIFRLL